MRRFTIVTVVLAASVAFLVGVIIAGGISPGRPIVVTAPGGSAAPAVHKATAPPTVAVAVNFADVAEKINAAVVNIDARTSGTREPRRRSDVDVDPREFDGPRQGSGSGFIIDGDGFILTNNHVIENAERITVTLADGRSFRGEVVGTDPAIDVALLRIPGARDLPEAALGDSDHIRVGEWVCAIGNPLGYVHSVTVGVISFVGRKLFDPSLDNYIQTDAAINFGNSGGPLINSAGQVIGINSAISSRASSIGFAVPINQAIGILEQLKTRGRVSRGFIGVFLTDVTPAFQQTLGLTVSHGALVQDLTPRSPAERAGLKPYDVIVDVDGRVVATNEELIRDISARQPGTIARLEVIRDGRRLTLPVKLAERPRRGEELDDPNEALTDRSRSRSLELPTQPALGLSVREMDRGFVGRLEIPDSVHGVVVSRVEPTGAAFGILRRGCVIMEMNRRPIRSVADYERMLRAAKPGSVMAVYYFDPTLGQRSLAAVTVD
jgi:serine protease Do